MRNLTAATVVTLLFTGCQIDRTPRTQTIDPDSAVHVEIRATMASYRAALLAGDARRASSFFMSGSRLNQPDAPDLVGAREIHDAFRTQFEQGSITELALDRSIMDVARSGAAWEAGTFRAAIRTARGADRTVRGRYTVRWRRGPEATWRIDNLLLNLYPPDSAGDTAAVR